MPRGFLLMVASVGVIRRTVTTALYLVLTGLEEEG